jgi:hypothetical protein
MTDDKLPQRTLRTTFWLSAFFALIFAVRGEMGVSYGLALGSAVGLLSLWSLTVAIPRLFHTGNPAAMFLLGMLTLCKLPIYAFALNFAVTSPHVSPFAVFVGAAFIPLVLVLKVVGYQIMEKANPAGEKTCQTKPAPSN